MIMLRKTFALVKSVLSNMIFIKFITHLGDETPGARQVVKRAAKKLGQTPSEDVHQGLGDH